MYHEEIIKRRIALFQDTITVYDLDISFNRETADLEALKVLSHSCYLYAFRGSRLNAISKVY